MKAKPRIAGIKVAPRQAGSRYIHPGKARPMVGCEVDEHGIITDIQSVGEPARDTSDSLLTQGLIDIQVNGFAGVDFNHPDLTANQMDHALGHLAASGVTCVLPTLITAYEPELIARLRALDRAVSQSLLGSLMVPGYHIEGPFLSPKEGSAGAHPAAAMRPVSVDLVTALQDASSRPLLIMTIAPEQNGVLALIPFLTGHGVACAIGHTAASRSQIRDAVGAGATLSTHLGNGLPHILNKNENPLFSQLGEDKLTASFIADGIHIHPQSLQTYFRAKTLARSIIVTDAVSAAGKDMAPGFYGIGDTQVERHEDGTVRIPGSTYLAGSSVSMDQMVRNLMNWYNFSLDDILTVARDNPTRIVGDFTGSLTIGSHANLVQWRSEGGALHVRATEIGPWVIRRQEQR